MKNKITYSSIMKITDDEFLVSNEHATIKNNGIFLLDKNNSTKSLFFVGKCGGEVRVELSIKVVQNANGSIDIQQNAKLYEGVSTSTTDLDGTAAKTDTVAPNSTKTINFKVKNTDEGGDYANLSLTVTNVLIADSDCKSSIKTKFEELGSAFTGNPITNINNPETVNGGKRVRFQKCDIYCSDAGVYEVHGEIRKKYNAVGGPDNDLKLPVTDETTTPDGIGKYNHFIGNGSIYWHPTTGPKLVRGGIRSHWAATGWERGFYGYPTSDEIKIRSNEWFSDFQNSVIYWKGNSYIAPKEATLSHQDLVKAVKKILIEKIQNYKNLEVNNVYISHISETGNDFIRSKNRKLTFRITGEYETGHWFIPNPDYEIDLRLAFETDKNPDGKVECKVLVRLDHWHIHTSGIGHSQLLSGLKQGILQAFNKPLELGVIPKNSGFLSLKILKSGDLKLYFIPDAMGSVAAYVAQQKLDELI